MRHVVLIGTSHNYQYGGNRCKPEDFERFKDRLRQVIQMHRVVAIAEEMNTDGLKEIGVTETSCAMIARELTMPHRYCDPGQFERDTLGMGSDLELEGFFKNWSEEELRARQECSWDKRRTYWLEQLRTFNMWPVLFICGSTHTVPFPMMLARASLGVTIADEYWTPDSLKPTGPGSEAH